MLQIIDIEIIKKELLKNEMHSINFSKKISFQFPPLYKEIVCHIKTLEISAECILYNSVASTNATKEFSDVEYWSKGFNIDNIKDYWFFGANGQGDSWLLNENNQVFFYDHNQGVIAKENLIDLSIDFEKWLQFAFLNKQLEENDHNEILNQDLSATYRSKLADLSLGLAERYPFEI